MFSDSVGDHANEIFGPPVEARTSRQLIISKYPKPSVRGRRAFRASSAFLPPTATNAASPAPQTPRAALSSPPRLLTSYVRFCALLALPCGGE